MLFSHVSVFQDRRGIKGSGCKKVGDSSIRRAKKVHITHACPEFANSSWWAPWTGHFIALGTWVKHSWKALLLLAISRASTSLQLLALSRDVEAFPWQNSWGEQSMGWNTHCKTGNVTPPWMLPVLPTNTLFYFFRTYCQTALNSNETIGGTSDFTWLVKPGQSQPESLVKH